MPLGAHMITFKSYEFYHRFRMCHTTVTLYHVRGLDHLFTQEQEIKINLSFNDFRPTVVLHKYPPNLR